MGFKIPNNLTAFVRKYFFKSKKFSNKKIFFLDVNVAHEEHVYCAPPPRYEIQQQSSPEPVTMLESATLLNIDEPIIHEPYCPIEFWNISERAASALLNTNYAMETAHFQIKVFKKNF